MPHSTVAPPMPSRFVLVWARRLGSSPQGPLPRAAGASSQPAGCLSSEQVRENKAKVGCPQRSSLVFTRCHFATAFGYTLWEGVTRCGRGLHTVGGGYTRVWPRRQDHWGHLGGWTPHSPPGKSYQQLLWQDEKAGLVRYGGFPREPGKGHPSR